jgi:transcriptional regulator with XRE-family HTH domain
MAALTTQKIAYFKKLYLSPKENGCYRTLAEVSEGNGYSVQQMTRILKDAGVEFTSGSRGARLNNSEFRGKVKGKFRRAIMTLPKLRASRKRLKIPQQTVAEILGVPKHWISNMENNMLRPTPARIAAYYDALVALDPKKSAGVRAAAAESCRQFTDPDKRDESGSRKSRAGSWGEFLDGLTQAEVMALKSALNYRTSTASERRLATMARKQAAA